MFLEVIRFNFEFDILEWFYRIGSEFLTFLATVLGQSGEALTLLPILTLIYWCIDKEKGKKIVIVTILGFNLNNLIKGLFYAKRPFEYDGYSHLRKLDEAKDAASGSSFPSGHSQNTATLATSIFHFFKNKAVRILCIVLMILVPISRVYLGVHFPGDVVVGTLIGILIVPMFCLLYQNTKRENLLYIIICAVLALGILLNLKPNCKDYYKCFGMFFGIVLGFNVEEKKINFKMVKNNFLKNLIRLILGLSIVGLMYLGVHYFIHIKAIESSLVALYISCFVTHALLSFVSIVLVPFIFTKIKYLSE